MQKKTPSDIFRQFLNFFLIFHNISIQEKKDRNKIMHNNIRHTIPTKTRNDTLYETRPPQTYSMYINNQ